MANKELERIKEILLDKVDEQFLTDILQQYEGQEDIVIEVFKETFSEIIEDADPYKWPVVSPETFLNDPYYCGINPKTGIGIAESMYPALREDFIKIHSPDSTIQEVILTGSIGWGKSFMIEIGLLWQLYLLSCLKSPQRFYNLAPDSPIGIIIISITERQGKKNIFDTVKGMINRCQYFCDNFMYNKKKQADSLIFPNKIELFPASSSHSANIGLNLFSGGMDEVNFFRKIKNSKKSESGNGVFDAARTLYRSLRRRLDSRFMKHGKTPGILYLGSSRVYPNDFTSEHITKSEEIEQKTGKKTVYVMDYNQWTVNRSAYSKEEFQVEIGDLNRRSRILTKHDKPVGKVINVPMDFYDKFEADIENSIRDIAGYGIHAIQPFIGNKDKIVNMFDDTLPRVFSVDVATLSPKPEFVSVEYLMNKPVDPGKSRYIAQDIGLRKDSFGYCLNEDTEITIKGGCVKKIKDIVIGDHVIDMFGESKRVINKFDNGNKDTITITYSGVELTGTEDHKVLCIKRKNITKWDRVVFPENKKYARFAKKMDYTPTWVCLKDIEEGDFVANVKHKFSQELKWNRDFCWLYGIYLAEGSTVKKENKVCWSLNKNEVLYANEIIRILKKEFNRHAWVYQSKTNGSQTVKSHCLDVFMPFVTDGAHNKHIKSSFFHKLTDDQIHWILMGLMDGDGHISSTTHQIKWTTVSPKLANQIYIMLTKLGFKPFHNKCFDKLSTHEVHKILLTGDDYFKWIGMKSTNKRDTSYAFKHNDMVFYPIHKKVNSGVKHVYDIEVESTHSYIANGIIVHNCMGYIDGYKKMKREFFNNETQQLETYEERLPICIVELVLEIRPEKEYGEVEIARVRNLIYQSIKRGYKIRRASADGFQSKDMEQQLKRNGIKAEYISMDRTPEPYETFRTAMYDGRIRCVYHPKLEIELNDLERDYSKNGKIDHPPYSSKDLADAVASLVYNMHINPIYTTDDLMIQQVNKVDDSEYNDYNTGDSEKDAFLKWAYSEVIKS